jgi:hypothetical protein
LSRRTSPDDREKHERALEHADQVQLARMIEADLPGQRADTFLYLNGGKEGVHDSRLLILDS